MSDLQSVFDTLKRLLEKYEPPFTPRTKSQAFYDLWSSKEVLINGRKKKEVYFAGLSIQKSYVGFYFMPVYVETEMKSVFSADLLKLLKGKSCFHIKELTPELVTQIESALRLGFDLYRQRGWV